MSLAATCWWTLVRTIALCLLAWPVCRIIERCLRSLTDLQQIRLLICLLIPAAFPELLVGYSFRDIALAHPKLAEWICSGLLFVRIVPVGTIALLAAPPSSNDPAAIHCRKMLGRAPLNTWRSKFELLRCYWHGPIVNALPALALMSIVAFQEFEMAALLQTISWTDWFVVAQRLGLRQDEMLIQSLWPLAYQLPVYIGIVRWLGSLTAESARAAPNGDGTDSSASKRVCIIGFLCVAGLVVIGCLIPLGHIGWSALDGLSLLLRNREQQKGLAREVAISIAVSLCAGFTAWIISGRSRRIAASGAFLGLFGSLLLSLGCVALFQQPWLRPLYDTPFPWVLALVAWLLPRAAILRLWLHVLRNDEAVHVARLLKPGQAQRRLLWRLHDQPRFLAVSLLCYWAYCDLPTAYMLAPTGMASGLVRLYNFMHFGRSAALSAEACVFFGAPILLISLLYASLRWWRI